MVDSYLLNKCYKNFSLDNITMSMHKFFVKFKYKNEIDYQWQFLHNLHVIHFAAITTNKSTTPGNGGFAYDIIQFLAKLNWKGRNHPFDLATSPVLQTFPHYDLNGPTNTDHFLWHSVSLKSVKELSPTPPDQRTRSIHLPLASKKGNEHVSNSIYTKVSLHSFHGNFRQNLPQLQFSMN